MTKAIRSYPMDEQIEVVRRRLAEKSMGIGYYSAVGWPGEQKKKTPAKEKKTGA